MPQADYWPEIQKPSYKQVRNSINRTVKHFQTDHTNLTLPASNKGSQIPIYEILTPYFLCHSAQRRKRIKIKRGHILAVQDLFIQFTFESIIQAKLEHCQRDLGGWTHIINTAAFKSYNPCLPFLDRSISRKNIPTRSVPLFPSRSVLCYSSEQSLWNLSHKALANTQPSGLGINPWKAGPSPQLGQDWAGQGRAPPGWAGHLSPKEHWGHWWLLGWESPWILLCPQLMAQSCLSQVVAAHPAPQDSLFLAVVVAHNASLWEKQMRKLNSFHNHRAEPLPCSSSAEHFYAAIESSFIQTQERRQRIMKPCIPLASKCSCGGKGFFWR